MPASGRVLAGMPQEGPVPDEQDVGAATWHTFQLRGGVEFLSDIDTTISLESEGVGGTEFDLDEIFGFDESTESIRFDAYYRFNRHHRVNLTYFEIERDGSTAATTQDIQFGEILIPAGSSVMSNFDTGILKASYQYTFFPEETWELGASIGLFAMFLDLGAQVNALGVSESFRTPLPLPVLGLHGTWEFLPKLRVIGSTEVFYLELDNVGSTDEIEGVLWDSVLSLEYDLLDHLGVGLGYEYFFMDADMDKDELTLSADYRFQGIYAYAALVF